MTTFWNTDPPGRKAKTANQTVTDSSTMANDTHLLVPNIQAGRTYSFHGRLYVTTLNILSLEVHYRHLPLYVDTAK